MDLRVDTSRVTGGIAYVDRAAPDLGAWLEIDRLNLDAYVPDLTGVGYGGTACSARGRGEARFGRLAGRVRRQFNDIGTLTVAGVPVQQAKLDGTLTNGT